MKTVQIHYIEFEDIVLASKNDNYPNSGLFVVKIKKGNSDLRFVDKTIEMNYCIVPESVFNGAVNFKNELEAIPEETPAKYDGDFILEFSRILLNRK